MTADRITREIARDGSVVLGDARCRFVFRALRAGVFEIQLFGIDHGQFGTATFDELAVALLRERSLELYLDASQGSIPSVNVSRAWTRFFENHRKSLKRVRILASSKSVALTMGIIRHLSNTGDLLQIYSDRELYETRKASS